MGPMMESDQLLQCIRKFPWLMRQFLRQHLIQVGKRESEIGFCNGSFNGSERALARVPSTD